MRTWSSFVLNRKFSGLRSRWHMLCSLWQYSIALWRHPKRTVARNKRHRACSFRYQRLTNEAMKVNWNSRAMLMSFRRYSSTIACGQHTLPNPASATGGPLCDNRCSSPWNNVRMRRSSVQRIDIAQKAVSEIDRHR